MSEINFVETDAAEIERQVVQTYESISGETLYPGDARRIFLQSIVYALVNFYADLNDSGRQNLLRYARGEVLESLAELYGVTRMAAQPATVTMQFTASIAGALNVPAGTRVTPDGLLFFETTKALIGGAGVTSGTVEAQSTEGGAAYNGYTSGQITQLVDPVPYISSVTNTTTSSGGADIETDDELRERTRLAPEAFSVAGPAGAYEYWAQTADSNIIDVSVYSPSAGVVNVVILMTGGTDPSQDTIDAVTAVLSNKTRRPLTDNVVVMAPTAVTYNISLTYYISTTQETDAASIQAAVLAAIEEYKTEQSASLSLDVNPSQLIHKIITAGAIRVDVISPTYAAVGDAQVARLGTESITYGGLI